MNRFTKNIILILSIIGIGVSEYFTMNYAKNNISNTQIYMNIDNHSEQNFDNNASFQTPPEIPNDTDNQNNNMERSADNAQNIEQGQNFTDSNQKSDTSNLELVYYLLFILENMLISIIFIYLIMSKFCNKNLKQTLESIDKIWIYILSVILLSACLTFLSSYITKTYFLSSTNNNKEQEKSSQNIGGGQNSTSDTSINAEGNVTIDGTNQSLSENYIASNIDESVILVKNGGNATITNVTIKKSGGDSSNTENSEFYGINAGILVTKNSTATINDSQISTNAEGSNAIFSTGTDSKIYVNNSNITTAGSRSARGLDATYGGYIEADNITIKTQGSSCATLATDRGEGTVIAKNSDLETNGTGSPIIYSTGNISISNTTGIANNSQMVVIEGKNSANIEKSTLKCNGNGNRNNVDNCGMMIYQSMSGDAGEGTGTLTASDSTLEINFDSNYYKSAPFFFITNTQAIINLKNCIMKYGSDLLLKIQGTSEWGKSGSNGGNVVLNADSQILNGNIELDNISSLDINLKNGSILSSAINNSNTAKSVKLYLDNSSKFELSGDTYITNLSNEDSSNNNIIFNGYKLYVNNVSVN